MGSLDLDLSGSISLEPGRERAFEVVGDNKDEGDAQGDENPNKKVNVRTMKTSTILPLLTILSCINQGGGVRNLAYDDDDVGDANGYWEYQWGGDYAGDNDGVDGNVVYADDEDASYDDDIYSYFFDAYGGMDGSDDDGGAGAMIYNDDDLFSLFFGQDESSRSNRRHQRRRKRIRLLALMVMVLSGVIAMLCCCCCWLFRQRCQKTFGLEGPKDNTYVHMKEGVIV